jgi:L-arabinose transport system substrate-binding protein
MTIKGNRRAIGRTAVVAIAGAAIISATLAGCSAPTAGPTGSTTGATTLRIAYIQKLGDSQYFIDEASGAKAAAADLGAEVTVINVGSDANDAISQLDTVISQGYDAIAIVVPDQKIGPQVIEAAKAAGIPLLATDDAIQDKSGTAAPFVGFDGTAMGEKVGAKAAELYKTYGWKDGDTRILRISKQDLPTSEDRVNGALDAFTKANSTAPEVISVGTDGTTIDAQDKVAAAITANPGVKHWIVWGPNDESVTGGVTSLQNSGVAPDDILGVGLGAYLACKDWAAGVNSGNKAALYISGVDVGKAAIKVLVDAVANGKDLPLNTIADTSVVDASTYKTAGVACG